MSELPIVNWMWLIWSSEMTCLHYLNTLPRQDDEPDNTLIRFAAVDGPAPGSV